MHLPLSDAEISRALKAPRILVDCAVRSGNLQRTISCPYRTNPDLNWSSIYDAIEYGLTIGSFGVRLKREDAVMWLFLLAEADESSDFTKRTIEQKAGVLALHAINDGILSNPTTAKQVAQTILEVQSCIKKMCESSETFQQQ